MRFIALILLSGLLVSAAACGAAKTRGNGQGSASTHTLSADYASWPKINQETIERGGDDEDGEGEERTAVELFAKVQGALDVGTVLVKQTSVIGADVPSSLGVMRRVGGSLNGGWAFEAYDAATMSKAETDVATCVNCHSMADNNYLFSDRSAVMGAAPSSANDGPPRF